MAPRGSSRTYGDSLIAPDYAWWHGFYECKKRFNKFMKEANELLSNNKKEYKAVDFPNATGNKTKPKEVFGK